MGSHDSCSFFQIALWRGFAITYQMPESLACTFGLMSLQSQIKLPREISNLHQTTTLLQVLMQYGFQKWSQLVGYLAGIWNDIEVFWAKFKGYEGLCCIQIPIPSIIILMNELKIYDHHYTTSKHQKIILEPIFSVQLLSPIFQKQEQQINLFISLYNTNKERISINFKLINKVFLVAAMQELIPLEYIKKHFSITIIKLHEPIKVDNAAFYYAITNFGSMTLVIQNYSDTICGTKTTEFLAIRNKLITSEQKLFPMVLEQQVIINHPQQIICMTLIQKCDILKKSQYLIGQHTSVFKAKINKVAKIVKTGSVFHKQGLYIDPRYGFQCYLVGQYQKSLFYDFTKIRVAGGDYQNISRTNFQNLRMSIKQMMCFYYNSQYPRIKQIFFIHEKVYRFVPENILNASDYFQLQLYLNIYDNDQIEIQFEPFSPEKRSNKQPKIQIQRRKLTLIQNLRGKPRIINQNRLYEELEFVEGRCLNCMAELSYEELTEKFVSEDVRYYRLIRNNLVSVKAKPQNSSTTDSFKFIDFVQKSNQANLIIYPNIGKFQLITFLLAYFRCIEPIIYSIIYNFNANQLILEFQNKNGQQRVFKMLFYDEYEIKDEEISIIIQKARIKNCKVKIQFLKISDPFLYFLANSQKLLKIHELYISDCAGISESGINTLLISPFCKNLHTLSIISSSKLLDTAIQAISLKSTMKNLSLINCKKIIQKLQSRLQQTEENDPTIDFSKMHFEELSLKGVTVNLEKMLPNTLRTLSLDQMIAVDAIKNIKNLRLQKLKIKLYEPIYKKSLFNSIVSKLDSNISKTNVVRTFLQGNSKDSLKFLDLTGSLVKYRTMKPLFFIKSLQTLILQQCSNLGTEIDPLPPNILTISIAKNPTFTLQNLSILLDQTQILIELNIHSTKMNKTELLAYFGNKKKKIHVNNLIVSEDMYSNRLIDTKSGLQNIQTVEIILNKMLYPENQQVFNYMIHKISKSPKTVRLSILKNSQLEELIEKKMNLLKQKQYKTKIQLKSTAKKQLLVEKIRKYLIMQSKCVTKFKNLYIDGKNFQQIFFDEAPQDIQQGQTIDYKHLKVQTTNSTFNFSPRIKFPQLNHPINFMANSNETIDKIVIKFVDLIRNYKVDNPIHVNLKDNKLVDKNIILMLLLYGEDRIRNIDFRGCLFSYQEVIEDIFNFTLIEELNNSEHEIHLNKQNFITNSQKYLKFFMRMKPIKKLSLYIEQTQQVQILYSVLYHIIDQHSNSITSLAIHFTTVKINKQGEMFFEKLFEMPNLRQLNLSIINCFVKDEKYYLVWQDGINKLQGLKKLKLMLPSFQYPIIRLRELEQVSLEFADQQIHENHLHKCLKNLHNSQDLKSLRINASTCRNIIHLNKIFGSGIGVGSGIGGNLLQKLRNLQNLSLNFQYCPLKESALFEFLNGFPKNQKMKTLQLDISFAVSNLNQLFACLENISSNFNRSINMRIICVTQNSNNYVFNRQEMSQNGLQFIL